MTCGDANEEPGVLSIKCDPYLSTALLVLPGKELLAIFTGDACHVTWLL